MTESTSAIATAAQDRRDIETVKRFFVALEAGDVDAAAELLAEDVVYQNVPLAPVRGKAMTVKVLRRYFARCTRFEVTFHAAAATDGTVLTERTDVFEAPPVFIDGWVCGTFEVRDGAIHLWRDYFDWSQVLLSVAMGPFRKLRERLRDR